MTTEKNKKIAESMKGNSNAEKWTLEEATMFFNKALELSYNEKYDFLGEIAKELKSYIDVFDYLTEKFPDLESTKKQIKRNCEANCFSNSKKGIINTAVGIVNLKSNHGWTDRVDKTSKGEKIQQPILANDPLANGDKDDNGITED